MLGFSNLDLSVRKRNGLSESEHWSNPQEHNLDKLEDDERTNLPIQKMIADPGNIAFSRDGSWLIFNS